MNPNLPRRFGDDSLLPLFVSPRLLEALATETAVAPPNSAEKSCPVEECV